MDTQAPTEQWPPPGCPPLAWPVLSRPEQRLAWYQAVISAYSVLWEGHSSEPSLSPVTEKQLSALEHRLNCELPLPLRRYHAELGALSLAETLCSVTDTDTPMQPLLEAFPSFLDICNNPAERLLAEELVVFGDYLGNGNMFCFHRATGEVYYFDHDDGALLSNFFPSTELYLDALMIRCLSEIYQDDETGEDLLAVRFGQALVRKWLY